MPIVLFFRIHSCLGCERLLCVFLHISRLNRTFAVGNTVKHYDYVNRREEGKDGKELCHQLKENPENKESSICYCPCWCYHYHRSQVEGKANHLCRLMAKTRLLLDTCAVIDLITSLQETDVEFWDIYDDPDAMPYASFETARELVVHFNNKRLLSKHWQTAKLE